MDTPKLGVDDGEQGDNILVGQARSTNAAMDGVAALGCGRAVGRDRHDLRHRAG